MHFMRQHVLKGCSGHTKRSFYYAFLRQECFINLDNWNEKLRASLPPVQWRKNSSLIREGGGWDSSLFPVTTSFGITQNLHVEWCMFIIGVGCNFFWNGCSSGLYLKFSFDFFFRQTFSFIQVFYLIALFLQRYQFNS